VVAVRTPPPLPRPIEQRQAQAGGHLNQQALVRPSLVRPMGAAQPAPMNQGNRSQPTSTPAQASTPTQNGFKPFTQPNGSSNNNNNGGNNGGNNQVRQLPQAQPRVLEEQGTPPPQNRNVPQQNRTVPPNPNYRPPQQQETHPLVRPAPPVQERSPQQEQQQEQKFNQWHEQRPATPPPAPKPAPRAPEPKPAEKPAKK
jgi:hypothetical protein